jgi:hypothetical protein
MTLLQAHRILIGSALALFLLYGLLTLSGRLPAGGRWRRVEGGASLLVAAGLGAYLYTLRGGRDQGGL